VKQQLTLRLDADVVAWFKAHTKSAKGYQTRINQALREYVRYQQNRNPSVAPSAHNARPSDPNEERK